MLTERSELYELIEAAIKAADAANSKGILLSSAAVSRCLDVLKRIKGLSLSAMDIYNSKTLYRLKSLSNHRNPKIRSEVSDMFDLWLRTLFASGRDDRNKDGPAIPLQTKPNPLEVSGNLRFSVLKRDENTGEGRPECEKETSTDETQLLELFEAAKKNADAANVKGILLGQTEASCCVDALSRLKTFTVSQRVLEANHIIERLEHLAKHKNQKIRSSASTLIQHWRQTIQNQERQDSVSLKKPIDHKTRGGQPVIRLKLRKRIPLSSTASDCVDRAAQKRPLMEEKPNPLIVSENLGSCILKGSSGSETVEEAIPKNKTDLLELFETAEKEANAAAEGSSSPAACRCVEALNQIERMPRSLALDAIFTTYIGHRLLSLTHHVNPDIRSAAKSLFYCWFRILLTTKRNSSTQKTIERKNVSRTVGCITSKKCKGDRLKSLLKKMKSRARR